MKEQKIEIPKLKLCDIISYFNYDEIIKNHTMVTIECKGHTMEIDFNETMFCDFLSVEKVWDEKKKDYTLNLLGDANATVYIILSDLDFKKYFKKDINMDEELFNTCKNYIESNG